MIFIGLQDEASPTFDKVELPKNPHLFEPLQGPIDRRPVTAIDFIFELRKGEWQRVFFEDLKNRSERLRNAQTAFLAESKDRIHIT